MEISQYRALAALQDKHWFYQFRRDLIQKKLARHLPDSKSLRLLDFGAGMGANTSVLETWGEVVLVEPEPIAYEFLKTRQNPQKVFRSIDEIPGDIRGNGFDVILVSYVLYHRNIQDPVATLSRLRTLAKDGALLIHLEPAFPSLTRALDVLVGGIRRFSRSQITEIERKSGWNPLQTGFVLPSLFPLAWLLARLDQVRISRNEKPQALELDTPAWLNRLISLWLKTGDRVLTWACAPFGIGLISIALNKEEKND